MKLTVAAAHFAPVLLDRDASIEKAIGIIAEAGSADVDLLVFPEAFVPGFPHWINCYPPLVFSGANTEYLQQGVEIPGPEITRVQRAARDAGVSVVLGVNERVGGTGYNTQVFIDGEGALVGRHRKIQATFAERTVWGQGDGSTLDVFDLAAAKVGGLICWEHTMNLARQALILKGEQIHVASWPGLSTLAGFSEVFDKQVESMMHNHAISGQVFCVVAGSPVPESHLEAMAARLGPQEFLTAGSGWSGIFHPMGGLMTSHTGLEEKLVTAEINLDDILAMKPFVDAAGHYGRADMLRLVIDEAPTVPLERLNSGSGQIRQPLGATEETTREA